MLTKKEIEDYRDYLEATRSEDDEAATFGTTLCGLAIRALELEEFRKWVEDEQCKDHFRKGGECRADRDIDCLTCIQRKASELGGGE